MRLRDAQKLKIGTTVVYNSYAWEVADVTHHGKKNVTFYLKNDNGDTVGAAPYKEVQIYKEDEEKSDVKLTKTKHGFKATSKKKDLRNVNLDEMVKKELVDATPEKTPPATSDKPTTTRDHMMSFNATLDFAVREALAQAFSEAHVGGQVGIDEKEGQTPRRFLKLKEAVKNISNAFTRVDKVLEFASDNYLTSDEIPDEEPDEDEEGRYNKRIFEMSTDGWRVSCKSCGKKHNPTDDLEDEDKHFSSCEHHPDYEEEDEEDDL